jgi:ABC-type spermidine/putrescine transport system permease subunit II
VATSWVPSAWNYFNDLKAWVRPSHNLMSVAVMAAVCFRPIATLFAFLLWRSVVALRRLLMHVSCSVVTLPEKEQVCCVYS